MTGHPYREPARPELHDDGGAAPASAISPDDVAVALVLFVLGGAGVAVGLYCDRALELTLGMIMLVLALKVSRDARRAGGS